MLKMILLVFTLIGNTILVAAQGVPDIQRGYLTTRTTYSATPQRAIALGKNQKSFPSTVTVEPADKSVTIDGFKHLISRIDTLEGSSVFTLHFTDGWKLLVLPDFKQYVMDTGKCRIVYDFKVQP